MSKLFYEMQNVGKARYVVNMHDGVQTHRDGSPFYGTAIFNNKRLKNRYVRELKRQGYVERGYDTHRPSPDEVIARAAAARIAHETGVKRQF